MQDLKYLVTEIAGFGITSADAARLATFYQSALGATLLGSERRTGARFERSMGVQGGATGYHLALGRERLDILQFDAPGALYPRVSSPYSPVFQHFAVVVSDMSVAYSHLQAVPGWKPLSNGGPQRLPKRSGGVTAFKFQDPEGHPLELLQFPAGAIPAHWQQGTGRSLFLGIDHSAISVRDTSGSIEFYRALGFSVTGESSNRGPEQALLDGVHSPQVEVTALSVSKSTPHLELLCYEDDAKRLPVVLESNDVAATRIYCAVDHTGDSKSGEIMRLIKDPDGHHLHLTSRPTPSLAENRA